MSPELAETVDRIGFIDSPTSYKAAKITFAAFFIPLPALVVFIGEIIIFGYKEKEYVKPFKALFMPLLSPKCPSV